MKADLRVWCGMVDATGQKWEVVGGGDKGGIVVRAGLSVSVAQICLKP